MKKRILACFVTVSLISVLVLFTTQCWHDSAVSQNEVRTSEIFAGTQFEEKIFCDAAIDDDFDGSSVLVILDKNIGGINRQHKESFFGDFEKKHIEDLTKITGETALLDEEMFRQIFLIELPYGIRKISYL